jgi:ATP-binding cassette subfamily B protein
MLYVSPLLFLSTVLTLTATALVFKVFGGRAEILPGAAEDLGVVNGNIQEVIEGLKVVKAFTHEKQAKAALTSSTRPTAPRLPRPISIPRPSCLCP